MEQAPELSRTPRLTAATASLAAASEYGPFTVRRTVPRARAPQIPSEVSSAAGDYAVTARLDRAEPRQPAAAAVGRTAVAHLGLHQL